jgi:hypothetical protein
VEKTAPFCGQLFPDGCTIAISPAKLDNGAENNTTGLVLV